MIFLNENKICIIKIGDDDFILIDEIHKKLNAENLLLFFTKGKNITNSKLKDLIEKEEIKVIIIPYFFENIVLKNLLKDIKVPCICYNNLLDHRKTLVLVKSNKVKTLKNVYFEKAIKMNYDFLYLIKNKYNNIGRILSTFYLTDYLSEKVQNIMNVNISSCDELLLNKTVKFLKQNELLNDNSDVGTIEFEEF